MKAYRPLSKIDGGRLVFNSKHALNPSNPISIPCSVCQGCRIDRSRDWAVRCMHEAQMHTESAMINLTYSDEHLPADYSVHTRVWQLFMKRLRKAIDFKKIRFFSCGEYGDENHRPHYHGLIFGYDFPDKVFFKKTDQGHNLYTSAELEKAWGFGFCPIGDVTYQSAAYVSRYIMKKITGDRAVDHYVRQHPLTKHFVNTQPEFCLSSRKPGLGSTWFDKFKGDAFPSDFIIVDGKKHPVPKFYAKKLEEQELEQVKRNRKRGSLPRKKDNTPARLRVRAFIKSEQLKRLKRKL